MIEIYVSKHDENSVFHTITEAINAVPYEESAIIHIASGIYEEKLFSEKRDITFIGEGMGKTVITYSDGAADIMPDGSKRGTFRSYTAFFGGDRVRVKDLSIRNDAGDGRVVGQAVAVYSDATRANFENVEMFGRQDTLFTAPLPVTERQKNGFLGPRVLTTRKLTYQHFKSCRIYGDVDFIFGGADAVFDDCDIIVNDRRKTGLYDTDDRDQIGDNGYYINGYVTAACGIRENRGYIFRNCTITGEEGSKQGANFLGRPWRDEAKTVFLGCTVDDTFNPKRFSGWGAVDKDQPDTYYGEHATTDQTGNTVDLTSKSPWVRTIDDIKAAQLNQAAEDIIATVNQNQ